MRDQIEFAAIDLEDVEDVRRALRELAPDEVYHLASASFVPASWDDPVGTSTVASQRSRCSARRDPARPARNPVRERSIRRDLRLAPGGAAAGDDADCAADAVRRGQGVRALPHRRVPPSLRATRILGDPLQPRVAAPAIPIPDAKGDPRAAEISLGLKQELRLGDLSAQRDWGSRATTCGRCGSWRPRGAGRLRDRNRRGHTVEDFVAAAFEEVGLDWHDRVRYDDEFAAGAASRRRS